MRRFWGHGRKPLELEAELRAGRPEPRPELLQMLAERTREGESARPRARAPRLALAAALTAAMLAGLASVGGFGYAASAAQEAAKAVRTLVGKKPASAQPVARVSSGGDQYQPGFGWGDPNHNHSGPPELRRRGALRISHPGENVRVCFRLLLDEQADLLVSVLGPNGGKLALSQNGLRVLNATQAKTLHYRVLVPRVLNMCLVVRERQLVPGQTYRIRITARDPSGRTTTITIPFRA